MKNAILSAQFFLQTCKALVEKWLDRKDRRDQRVLTRFLIGHTRKTKQHLSDQTLSYNCEVCNTEHSVEQILPNCMKYDAIREELRLSSNIQIVL